MDARKLFSKTGLVFLALFILLTYIGMKLNFSTLVGEENQFFTLFQFFGPVAGGFLGAGIGAASVLVAELINFVLIGKEISAVNLLRLLPMLFAAYYFAKNKDRLLKDKLGIFVPLICIGLFMLHPIGSQVWYVSLLWLIPIIVKFLPDRLFLRSLGSTFSAHAVGGALWIWTVPMPAEAWIALIPVILFERTIFALGISTSYVAFNTILDKIDSLTLINLRKIITMEEKYVISAKNLHL